jgi:hypothetical protein
MTSCPSRPAMPSCLEPPGDGSPWAPPLDSCDIVVRLETAGITDAVAQCEYGYHNAWRLAEACFPWLRMFPASDVRESRQSPVIEYLKGLSFALPLGLCCLAMVVFRFSLWGGDVSPHLAVAVGLGTVSSFVTTGGVVQAMARRGLFFLSVRDGATGEVVCWRWVRLGVAWLAICGLVLLAPCRFYQWLPAPFDWIAFAFHVSLGLLWLATGILHMLERNLWSAVATFVGLCFVVLLHRMLQVPLVAAQIIGIVVAAAFAFSASYILLRARRRAHDGRPRSLSPALDLYLIWPHFLFGTLYFLLIFVDRLLAWTVPDISSASPVQFRGDYETMLDLALIGFVLQVGNVRASTFTFFRNLVRAQKQHGIGARVEFVHQMRQAYARSTARFVLMGAAVSTCLYLTASHLSAPVHARSGNLLWALLGGSLMVIGLWNTSLLFRLSLPVDVVAVTAPAVAIDLIVGYPLSRLASYHYAVVGFSAGACYFAALTTRSLWRRLESLDYYYFSSSV